MGNSSIQIRLFSPCNLDQGLAESAIRFFVVFGGGSLRPQECGVYEPFEHFEESSIAQYAAWIESPGGEFGFRGERRGLRFEGNIRNLSMPEIFSGSSGSHLTPLPAMRQPYYHSAWTLRVANHSGLNEHVDLAMSAFREALSVADAEYGYAADIEDFQNQHFRIFREGSSVVEQYIGDDPEDGLPGLYWLNYFGRPYFNFFGREKLDQTAHFASTSFVKNSAAFLQFGSTPEESRSANTKRNQQQTIELLGSSAFFDLRHPDRPLSKPPEIATSKPQ